MWRYLQHSQLSTVERPPATARPSAGTLSPIIPPAYHQGMTSSRPTFALLGEPLALDLVNTRVRQGDGEMEYLTDPTALDAWMAAQTDRMSWTDDCTDDDLAMILDLRDAIARLLDALVTKQPPHHAIDVLNKALRDFRGPELAWAEDAFEISTPDRSAQFAGVLHVIAADAVRLVAGPSGRLVRECARPQCSLRFVATNPRRQWCSTTSCGNRTRVARSYTRRTRTAV